MNDSLWTHCMLYGDDLDAAVARVLGVGAMPFSRDWCIGGPLIESNQIFLQPPTTVHVNGGPNSGWVRYEDWRATVSASVRTYPGPEFPPGTPRGWVGRGMGSTPLVAAMRAIVDSFGQQKS